MDDKTIATDFPQKKENHTFVYFLFLIAGIGIGLLISVYLLSNKMEQAKNHNQTKIMNMKEEKYIYKT